MRFGTVEKRSEGSYRAAWKVDGVNHRKGGFRTREEAERHLMLVQLGMEGGGSRTTLGDYWEAVVLPSMRDLEQKTKDGYVYLYDRFMLDMADTRLEDLDHARVQQWLDGIESPTLQRSALRLLRKVGNMAEADGTLQHSRFNARFRMRPHQKAPKALIEPQDVPEWLTDAFRTAYGCVLCLELGAGLRHEEACAVNAEDCAEVSVNGRRYVSVSVTRAVVTCKGGPVEKGTKNGTSTRSVLLGEPFASAFLDGMPDTPGPLCRKPDGSRTAPNTVTHNWRLWCSRHGREWVPPKNLRSSYATMQAEAGSPDSLVSLAMGHADGTTKGRNYMSARMRGAAMIADNLEEYVAECSGSRSAPAFEFPPQVAALLGLDL